MAAGVVVVPALLADIVVLPVLLVAGVVVVPALLAGWVGWHKSSLLQHQLLRQR